MPSNDTQERPGLAGRQFGQPDRGGLLFGFGAPSLVALGVAIVASLVGLRVDGIVGLLVALPIAGPLVASALVRRHGLPLVEWVPVVVVAWWRRRGGQDSYVAPAPGVHAAAELVLPGRQARHRLRPGPAGSAIVEDPTTGTWTTVGRVAHPPFVLADTADQEQRVLEWGTFLDQLGDASGLVRLQILERTAPDAPDAFATYFRTYVDRRAVVPGVAGRHYEELLAASADASAERHESFVAFVWAKKDLERDVRRSGGGDLGIAAVVEQRQRFVERVLGRAGVQVISWLSPPELASTIHTAYDPAFRSGTAVPADAGPQGMQEQWDRLRSDGGWHTAYVVTQWPRVKVQPDFLAPLILSSGIRRAVSLVIEPVSVESAEREIRAKKADMGADAAVKAKKGKVRSLRSEAELGDVLQREADLVAGHAELRFAGLVAVSGRSEGDLEAACVALEHGAKAAHLELRRLYHQQGQGFAAAALPLGLNVLRGSRR